MALEIEDLKTKVRQAPRGKTLRRLKLKATEAMKRFDDMAKHHATFKMQLEDLSGTLGCFSSQSEGVSSADNSPRSSAAGLPSDFFGSSSSSPRSKPARQQFPPNLSSKAQQAGHATTNTKRQTQSSTQVSSAIAHPKAASPSSMHSTTARGTFQDCNIAKNVQRAWVKLKSSLPLPQTQRMFVQRLAAPTRSTSQCGQTLTFHANQSWRDRIYPRSRGRWRKTWTADERVAVASNSNLGLAETGNETDNGPTVVPTGMPNKQAESERGGNGQDKEIYPSTTTAVPVESLKKRKKKTKKVKQATKSSSGLSKPVPQNGPQIRRSSSGNSAGSTGAIMVESQTGQDIRTKTGVASPLLYPASSDRSGSGIMTPDTESSSAPRSDLPAVSRRQASMPWAGIHQPAPSSPTALERHMTPFPDRTEAGTPINSRALPATPASQSARIDFTWGHYSPNQRSLHSQAITPPESVQSVFSSPMDSRLHNGDCVESDPSGCGTSTTGSDCSSLYPGFQHYASPAPIQPVQPSQFFHPIPSWMLPSRYMSRSVPIDVSMQIRPPSEVGSEVGSSRGALSENDADEYEPVRDD
ncbi:hypothetical protein PgNI_10861 [Pyricularia grisea]|uniref:Uncharacterized protein n=1 Tax=Pyricularia grisea TaxID=148305 RepID=A0A6P8AZY2_PYRGI|nr:hypothetical protein PgNI_10861 [Pyricularia grisea]TLD07882.1 hypothetical protein PgNI_10861 [Pyricularia grisea]